MKTLKKEASDFLNKRGRRIDFIFFGLLLIFVTLVPVYAFVYFDYLFAILADHISKSAQLALSVSNGFSLGASVLSGVLAGSVVLFLTCPVYYALFSYSYKSYREGIAGEPRFFSFGKFGYLGALRSGILLFGIFALCLAPVIAFVEVGTRFAFSDDKRIASLINYLFFIIVALGLVIGFLIFMLFRPLFLFGYYSARGKNVRESLSLSVKRMRSARAKGIYKAYIKSFLPSLILSVATIMVLFIVDTLPRMMTVYYMIADDIVYGEK